METKDIKQTYVYNLLKDSIRQTLIERNKDLIEELMSIVENLIKDNLMKDDMIRQEVIRKYSSPIALIPMWTKEDNIMIDDIISNAKQHTDLDSEQIEHLKNLKDRSNKLIKTLDKDNI